MASKREPSPEELGRIGALFSSSIPQPPELPPDGARWIEFANYFDKLFRSIPASGEPEILSFPGEPWKELAEWESVAAAADGEAVEAILHLLRTGAWPRQKRRADFWFRVEQRIQNAKDLAILLAMQLSTPGHRAEDAVPPPALPAIAIAEWLLLHVWDAAGWMRERFRPNPWMQYP